MLKRDEAYLRQLIRKILEEEGVERLKIGERTSYISNAMLHIAASIPSVRLEGTEAGALNLAVRENAGFLELYDVVAALVRTKWSGTTGRRITPLINSSEITVDEIQVVVPLTVVSDAAGVTAAAAAIAVVNFPHTTFVLPALSIKHLKSAILGIDYTWAATADGYIELYDATGLAVRATTALLVGAEASTWATVAVTGLVAGNSHIVRANVTVAGAAGEVATLFRAVLILTLGVA